MQYFSKKLFLFSKLSIRKMQGFIYLGTKVVIPSIYLLRAPYTLILQLVVPLPAVGQGMQDRLSVSSTEVVLIL